MKIGKRGIAKVAIVAIVVIVIVAVAVVAVLQMKPTAETPTPTGQATPTPGGEVIPKPGATLIGPIEISQHASGGTINFTMSEDGASITYIRVTLNDVDTDYFSAESMSQETPSSIPVTSGAFSASVSSIGEIEGQFTSPTEASGTINLLLEIYQVGTVEFGKWNWSAKTG